MQIVRLGASLRGRAGGDGDAHGSLLVTKRRVVNPSVSTSPVRQARRCLRRGDQRNRRQGRRAGELVAPAAGSCESAAHGAPACSGVCSQISVKRAELTHVYCRFAAKSLVTKIIATRVPSRLWGSVMGTARVARGFTAQMGHIRPA